MEADTQELKSLILNIFTLGRLAQMARDNKDNEAEKYVMDVGTASYKRISDEIDRLSAKED